MAFVRTHFDGDVKRNGSILKALVRRWGIQETNYMVRGANLLHWPSLYALNAEEGIGRRWAVAAFWDSQKKGGPSLEAVGQMLRKAGL